MIFVQRPFKGTWFYEWQIGPLVIQIRHTRGLAPGRYSIGSLWLDPYWRRS